jgi:hypothetical protein
MEQTSKNTKPESFFSKFLSNKKLKALIRKEKKVIKQQQKEIIEQYQLIGEKVYQYHMKDADVGEEFEGYCKNIRLKVADILGHSNTIEELKQKIK